MGASSRLPQIRSHRLAPRRPPEAPLPATAHGRRSPGPAGCRGLLRRGAIATAAALLLPLQGCIGQRLAPRQTLHVVVVPTDQLEWMGRDYIRAGRAIEPLLRAFRRLQPDVAIEISLQHPSVVSSTLRASTSRGLAPDLLLLRAPQAVSLLAQGLVDPLPAGEASIQELKQLLLPAELRRVSTSQGLAGLPIFTEFTLACYDRRRLPQSPQTLSELVTVAASGHAIGLSVDPIGLWWTVGSLGAREVMNPIILGRPEPSSLSSAQQLQSLETWLRWLRQAALQSRIEIDSGTRELTLGLESGQLAWAPCFSPTLVRLDRSMGRHLGVAPLPRGPGGEPSPFSTTQVWALGRNSAPQQRRLALQLAALSLDPLIQRQLMLSSHTILPANRFVPIPVASSGRLAALAAAKRQFELSSPLLSQPFRIERLQRLQPSLEALLMDVMVGLTTPEQGAKAVLRLRRHPAGGR
jgi:hypothetical protein